MERSEHDHGSGARSHGPFFSITSEPERAHCRPYHRVERCDRHSVFYSDIFGLADGGPLLACAGGPHHHVGGRDPARFSVCGFVQCRGACAQEARSHHWRLQFLLAAFDLYVVGVHGTTAYA